MKTYGIIPARMGSSRFPGKPLHPIAGKPMIEHVYARAKLSWDWDMLCIATCDEEIRDFSEKKGFPVVMTSDKHVRALDRVAEAYEILAEPKTDDDIVVCVQGDEPLLGSLSASNPLAMGLATCLPSNDCSEIRSTWSAPGDSGASSCGAIMTLGMYEAVSGALGECLDDCY